MSELFNLIFYQPILNLLVFFYNITPGNDIGLAIVALTVLIRLVSYPLNQQSIKSQKALRDLQPKIEEIKKKYAANKQEQGRAMMELYKAEKVNPFSSCLPLLIQFPFLIAVYYVFRDGLAGSKALDLVYPFIAKPEALNPITLGFFDLSKSSPVLAILAGIAQFWQVKMMSIQQPPNIAGARDESMAAIMNKQMLYFMPILTVFIGFTFPGGLTLYWLVTTLLTGLHQLYVFKKSHQSTNLNAGV